MEWKFKTQRNERADYEYKAIPGTLESPGPLFFKKKIKI